MVQIFVNEQDRTRQVRDWELYWCKKNAELRLKLMFPSGKVFTAPLTDCRVAPVRELTDALLTKPGGTQVQPVERVTIYDERWVVLYYPGGSRPYLYRLDEILLLPPTRLKQSAPFAYFQAVAQARQRQARSADERRMADNVVKQLERLPAFAGGALSAYCSGTFARCEPGAGLIYPFGVNASQLQAVEQAFSAQVSLIEGPPGTGKTQTILNILANILLRGQTVAVLSNNNAAVTNVYEKLAKVGLDYLVAKLGNQDNREAFFAQQPAVPVHTPEPPPTLAAIQQRLAHLKGYLHDQNQVAQLKAEIAELTLERQYLLAWRRENAVAPAPAPAPAPALERYGLSPRKTTDLMAYLNHLGERRLRLKDRLALLLRFGIVRTRSFAEPTARQAFFHALQLHYYDQALTEKTADLATRQANLAASDFVVLLETLTADSMHLLKAHLHEHIRHGETFDAKTYRRTFDTFVKRYPIIGSSTHSLVNSLGEGAMLDYVIIDEASQQDLIPGILALGCARNLIVVGDSRQLAHIPFILGLAAPTPAYDCERQSLLDSCLAVFGPSLPRTLLKEHYRCHPKIIQFCNQQFYDGALVPMTEDRGESPLRLVVTAKGNHARGNRNLRELDSLLAVLDQPGETVRFEGDGFGFIAPFRAQVTLSGQHLPAAVVKDTVHKFQGRECDEIVFSTVLDKKTTDPERLNFVDDPRLVNVAVSRAKHRFTLVTGDEVFTANHGHLAALLRYMTYYDPQAEVVRAPVVSAFDLLYREYDASLERLAARLRPDDSPHLSERIVTQLLREALAAPALAALMFHTQVPLWQVIETANPALTPPELTFLRQGASCDFVVYFRVGKLPVAVIEVDGGSHERPDQIACDALKDAILAKSGIALLRLRTVQSHIETRLAEFLGQWARQERSDKPAE